MKNVRSPILKNIAQDVILSGAGESVPPVPVPANIVATVTGFIESASLYTVSITWDEPSTAVDSYQYRSYDPQGDSTSNWRDVPSGEESGYVRDILRDAWIEIRSILDGRFSAPVRLIFSELTYPAIGVPQNFAVEIITDETNRFVVELTWDPPANAFGRTIRYFVDRGGTGFAYHNSGDRLNYAAARSLFPYFSVRAEAGGEESAYVRVNDADYIEPIEEPPRNVSIVIQTTGHTEDHIYAIVDWEHNEKGTPDFYEVRLDDVMWTRLSGLTTQFGLFVTTTHANHIFQIRSLRGDLVSEVVSIAQADWGDLRGQQSPSPLIIAIVDSQQRILRDPGGNVLGMRL